jgi:DNA invertase Pin-like site-specific DNA recombinase
MRCAMYSRVSTNHQEAENQLVQLREFARVMGWQLVAEYVDQITGKHSDRPEFQRMFHDASELANIWSGEIRPIGSIVTLVPEV